MPAVPMTKILTSTKLTQLLVKYVYILSELYNQTFVDLFFQIIFDNSWRVKIYTNITNPAGALVLQELN
jgi:hypothetical protein